MSCFTDDEMKVIRAARAKYAKEYRKKHPEKIREIQERYWKRRVDREHATKGGRNSDAENTRETD